MEETNIYYLEKAPVPKAVANMALPMILAMFVGVIQNIADTFFVGRLNNTDMITAVMLSLPVFTIFMAASNIFGIGCGTYISRLLGEKDYATAKKASSFSFYGSIILGFMLTIICYIFMNPILHLLGTSVHTIEPTKSFINILAGGGIFIMLSFSMGQIVRSEGASKQSMVGMMIATIGTIILDPIMIFTFHLGVSGSAASTVIANGLAAIYYCYYFIKKSEKLSISFKYFSPNIELIKNSFSIGIPVFITFILLLTSSLLLNIFSAKYGDAAVAILGIAVQINMIPEFLVSGLCEGVQPLIGYNYSANNNNRMNEIIRFTGICSMIISIFVSVFLYFSTNYILKIFITNSNIISLGAPLFRICMLAQVVYGIIFLFTNVFQATGKSLPSLIMSLSQGVLFIPAIIIGNSTFGLTGIAYALPISEFGTALFALLLYLWVKKDFYKSINNVIS